MGGPNEGPATSPFARRIVVVSLLDAWEQKERRPKVVQATGACCKDGGMLAAWLMAATYLDWKGIR